ncbi:transcriptional regulator [Motilibacter rhizosphaerae]|uniref:Transcriptional regulator n=1 Tax=Motilibacter rhizosphaerae TaxID=598652 RepID=A0A4Q7NBE7_9ACTN|nr:BTAD domain-containing putative transcriptional regulator [Motilibacter rhizosphaerae]RZS80183.1 transcriptional regulator [Motilibacter rhizosphaerae]
MLDFRLLGRLQVEQDGQPLPLGPPKQRALLALLLHETGSVVSSDRLVHEIWGEDASPQITSSLYALVSRLRQVVRDSPDTPSPLVRSGSGYLIDVVPGQLDAVRFQEGVRAARRAVEERDWRTAVDRGEAALREWRGPYLEEYADTEAVRLVTGSWLERRAGLLHDLTTGLLGLGDVAQAVAQARALVAECPLDERAVWLLLVALHRAGRTAEALTAYRDHATALDEELGLEVGGPLRDLQGALLRQDPGPAGWPGPGTTAAPVAVVPAPRSGLVGREAEREQVRAALDAARGTGCAWVVLSGRPGIGKTRLAEEAVELWRAGGGRVAQGRCPDDDAVPAWWPLRQVVRDLGADPATVLSAPGTADPATARYAVLEQVRDLVLAAVAEGPLLLLVDDVHWADPSTLRLLGLLADEVERPGLAVVLTARPGVGDPRLERVLARAARHPGSVHLALSPLTAPDVADLVEQVRGRRPDAAETAALTAVTGGVPLFAQEYAKLASADPEGAVPDAVRPVLARRLAELPEPVLEALRVAAVLGDPLDVRLLAEVLGSDVTSAADALDAAATAEVLVHSAASGGYAFTHALFRDEVAASVPALRRQRLHLAAAAAAHGGVRGDRALRRAGHLRAAGALADAAEVLAAARDAARTAEQQGQPEAAAGWWRSAVEAHELLLGADPAERDELVAAELTALTRSGRGQAVLDVLDAELVTALRAGRTASVGRLAANLLRVSGSWPWPVYGSDPAPLLATLRGLDGLLADDPAARARVLAVTAIGHCYDPDPSVPDGLSARALALAEATGDADVLADALLGRTLTYAGVASRSAESVELLERLRTLPHEQQDVDEVLRHNLLTMACMNLGRTAEAAEHISAGSLRSEVLRLPVNRVQLGWARACLAQWRGDLAEASRLYDEAEAAHRRTELQQAGTFELAALVLAWDRGTLAAASGDVPHNPVVARWTRAVADAAAGRPGGEEALAAEVHWPEPEVWTSHGRLALLAHVVADLERADLAPPLRARLAPLAGLLATLGQIGTVGPVSLALARLARLEGDRAAAGEHLADALALARREGGGSAEVHARAYALAWAAEDAGGLRGGDRAELEAVLAAASARGMTGTVERLGALLQERTARRS